MVAPALTRFVPSVAPPREVGVDDPATVTDVRCVVRLRDGGGATRELVVGTDATGAVKVLGSREGLGLEARGQLAFHEVASAGRAVEVDADEVWIFDLQTIEMLPDAPGLNDPLYVYGLMHGPFPAELGVERRAVEGQLTLTRADLLGGLVDGLARAFAYAPDEHGSRCVHALLPAERAEVIDGGRGIVVALPLVPSWLLEIPQSNDLVVAQLLYDVLVPLRAELGESEALPVPSRAAVEHELVSQGWRIEGDEAVRPKGSGLIGSLRSDKKKLPRQGSVDELAAIAKAALANLTASGWAPTPEARAIARRTEKRSASPITSSVSAPIPQATMPAPVPVVPPRAVPRPRVEAADRTEWMKDFVDAHRAPARPTPRVSAPARAVSKTATPEWMKDFEDPVKPDDE
ncbi:MAG: hypothetical protein HOV81_05515 [Kofleriaceae bacterium]|nr:hypothetical protein [Kofleriaceae bacterium]